MPPPPTGWVAFQISFGGLAQQQTIAFQFKKVNTTVLDPTAFVSGVGTFQGLHSLDLSWPLNISTWSLQAGSPPGTGATSGYILDLLVQNFQPDDVFSIKILTGATAGLSVLITDLKDTSQAGIPVYPKV